MKRLGTDTQKIIFIESSFAVEHSVEDRKFYYAVHVDVILLGKTMATAFKMNTV